MLLDLGLPNLDGIAVCWQLGSAQPEAVVVMLTARDDEMDVIINLEAGADDYLITLDRADRALFAALIRRLPAKLRGHRLVTPATVLRVAPPPGDHGRNAKLQLTVLLAPEESVDGLYLHPEHRRRARRADAPMGMDVQ